MTASELKYLLTVNELNEQSDGAKMVAIAKKLNVSKVSVYRAVERLSASGYMEQSGKAIVLTDKGKAAINEYLIVVGFIGNKLEKHCNTPKEVAFDEAVAAACALGEASRKAVMQFVKNNGTV